jgi:uncharacterized membrane protein YbhN (UPF0104 family)
LSEPGQGRLRRQLQGRLKFAVAIALLAWVGSSLPWSDRLFFHDPGSGFEAIYEGRIEGDWRASTIAFRVAIEAGQEFPPGQAGMELQAASSAGVPLRVTRRLPVEGSAPEAGWEWRPSFTRVFRGMDPGGLLWAMLFLVAGTLFGITRWWRLLRLAGCPASWRDSFRLTYLGLFFNLVFPGLTGGDLVKAVLVVREHPERRADALVTVLLDRMIGLWSLIGLATAVIWGLGPELARLRWPVTGAFLLASSISALVLVPGPRRALGLERLLARLPQGERLQKLDRAADLLHRRPLELAAAFLLSIGNHLCVATGVFAIGRALGDSLSAGTYVALVSVANTLSAIPITPGGWGWGEQAFGMLFALQGSEFALGVAISVTYRLCTLALGLCGGSFLLLPGGRRVRGEVREVGEALADRPHSADRIPSPSLPPQP